MPTLAAAGPAHGFWRLVPAWRRAALVWLAVATALALAACAAPTRASLGQPHWSGRLALQVAGETAQSFSAAFDLRGSPREGALELFTPLGSTAALIEWNPAGARLRAPGQPTREAASLPALVREATGADLPLAALFDWLDGQPTRAEGWQADLSQRAQGRLRAQRLALPQADLRVVLQETPP